MNILVLSHFAGSPRHGMVLRNYAMAREWVRQGHQVTIVACGYSHFRRVQPQFRGRVGQDTLDGIRYLWVWGPRHHGSSALGRLASMASYTLQCYLPLPLDSVYDMVMASSPHPFTIYPAARLARRFGARLIYDIRDLWPLTPMHLGRLKASHPFIRALQHAEDYACRHADLVTAIPGNAEDYLQSRGLPPGRFLAIGNGAMLNDDDGHQDSLPDGHQQLLDQLRARHAFILGYAGTLGTANAMELAVEAIAGSPPHIHLVMLGDGVDRRSLIKQASESGCADRVHFLPPVPQPIVVSFLSQVDLAYAGGHQSPLYAYGASLTKLNDYMLASVPILYGLEDPGNAVEASGAGICYAPGDVAALRTALITVAELPVQARAEMGKRGKEWVLKHQLVSSQVRLILETLNSIPLRTPSSRV